MGIFNIYSKRKKQKGNAGQQDVYKYDELPQELRIQIVHIWKSAIGIYRYRSSGFDEPQNKIWRFIKETLCREYGVFELHTDNNTPFVECSGFLLSENVDKALDIIELSFQCITQLDYTPKQSSDDAINELNDRFKEHSIGYQFVNRKIIKINDQFTHKEVILPAIQLLQDSRFRGASEEFLNAHEHYRKGNHKEAIAEALKSFESTMKTICAIKKWKVSPTATAKPLLDICFANCLIPARLQGHFGSIRAALENGLPTVSNSTARHGQGQKIVKVPEYIVIYVLHLTAANIILLLEAFKKMG